MPNQHTFPAPVPKTIPRSDGGTGANPSQTETKRRKAWAAEWSQVLKGRKRAK